MATRKMGNHHALRVIGPTFCDQFGVSSTGKGLRFFRDVAREKWPCSQHP
jgi:hypothetical protein